MGSLPVGPIMNREFTLQRVYYSHGCDRLPCETFAGSVAIRQSGQPSACNKQPQVWGREIEARTWEEGAPSPVSGDANVDVNNAKSCVLWREPLPGCSWLHWYRGQTHENLAYKISRYSICRAMTQSSGVVPPAWRWRHLELMHY